MLLAKIVHLSETERIELLMIIIGYVDRRRIFVQVVTLFNEIHPEWEPISKSTVSKTLRRFNKTGGVKERLKPGRPETATNDENALIVVLGATENSKTSVQHHNVSRKSIQTAMKKEKSHPYKIHVVHTKMILIVELNLPKLLWTEKKNGNFINMILFVSRIYVLFKWSCEHTELQVLVWYKSILDGTIPHTASRRTECLVRYYWLPCTWSFLHSWEFKFWAILNTVASTHTD